MSSFRDETPGQSLLNVKEFAERLGITTACVRKWLLEGKIAKVKLGRLVRIPSHECERLITEGSQPARQRRSGIAVS